MAIRVIPSGVLTAPPPGAIDEDTGETLTREAVPTWDAASRASAVAAAETVMRAFARPRGSAEAWWEALEPLLTPEAARDYAWVDPANVPATRIGRGARITDATSAYVACVAVPTDAGTYTVILSRTDANAPWLASRLTPPGRG